MKKRQINKLLKKNAALFYIYSFTMFGVYIRPSKCDCRRLNLYKKALSYVLSAE